MFKQVAKGISGFIAHDKIFYIFGGLFISCYGVSIPVRMVNGTLKIEDITRYI